MAYNGQAYEGWQSQLSGRTVQDKLEKALGQFTTQRISTLCAGRTDAGVHATAMIAHVDLAKDWRTDVVRDAANAHIKPLPVAILAADRVGDDFEARFSAVRRHYLYRICNRRAPLTWGQGLVWHVPRQLDADAMHRAAQRLLGRHDFTTFRASECQATSPIRTLEKLDVTRAGDEIHVVAAARSFLHHQVRSMVGSLEYVGNGKWSADDLEAALQSRDRTRCGMVCPPDGLYLTGVDYP